MNALKRLHDAPKPAAAKKTKVEKKPSPQLHAAEQLYYHYATNDYHPYPSGGKHQLRIDKMLEDKK